MQNKCNCGCQQGFVPVNGNWDFNSKGDCSCQQNGGSRMNRRCNGENRQCGEYESACSRDGEMEYRCEGRRGSDRCNNSREVECCDQNTYIRDMTAECGNEYTRGDYDDCGCKREACGSAGSRSRDCGCDKDDNARARMRSTCGCEKMCGCKDNDNGANYARSNKNRKVGMVNVERQELDEIFESESALRAGTLFPELHKPMNGYCPYDGNCGTCKQQAAFAAWEMRLYLNTHPGDKEALKLFQKLCKEAEEPNYATSFLKDDGFANSWDWVKNPWPWEYDCQCGD